MRLSATVHREGQQVMTPLRSNHNHETLCVAVTHDDTDRIWTIIIDPNGTITMSYGGISGPTPPLWLLGQFDSAGGLTVHEPRPLSIPIITTQE